MEEKKYWKKKILKSNFELANIQKPIFEKYVRETRENGEVVGIEFLPSENFNFAYDIVDELAKKSPDKTALLHVSKQGVEKRYSFSDLSVLSNKLANYFKYMGIKKGDRVMLVLGKDSSFWLSFLALSKLGAIAIPGVNMLKEHDFEYRFNFAKVNAIISIDDNSVTNEIDMASKKCPTLTRKILVGGKRAGWLQFDNYRYFISHLDRIDTNNKDTMMMFFTSGTTGQPKAVKHRYDYALAHYVTARYWHNVCPNGYHFTISDTGWAKSSWGNLFGQWLCESPVFIYDFDRFKPEEILPLFSKYGITTFCAPPTMYRMLMDYGLDKYDLSGLKHCTTAGEPLSKGDFQKFYEHTGLMIYEGFGQTEIALAIANLHNGSIKMGALGKPTPQYKVDLMKDDGSFAKNNEVGEIVLKTDGQLKTGFFDGYENDEIKTAKTHNNNYFHTGDTALRDDDGYYWYVGRNDNIIKSSGYRIGPFEVEQVIMELPYVKECLVSGAEDKMRGVVVKADIVLKDGVISSDNLKREIQEYVKAHTAPYKYPRIIEFIPELKKTTNGKILRASTINQQEMSR